MHKALNILVVTVYYYGLLIAGDSKADITPIKKDSSQAFEIEDLRPVNAMLRIEFTETIEVDNFSFFNRAHKMVPPLIQYTRIEIHLNSNGSVNHGKLTSAFAFP